MTTTTFETPTVGEERWEHWGGRGQTGRCHWCGRRIYREERHEYRDNVGGWLGMHEFRWVHMGYKDGERVSLTHCKAPDAPEDYAGVLIKRKAPRRRTNIFGSLRPRDSQKRKVYDWERAVVPNIFACVRPAGPRHSHDGHTAPMTIEECQRFIDKVASTYGRKIRVHPGRSSAHASGNHIYVGVACRTPGVLLHELAHCLSPYGAGHGAEYVRVYIDLLARHLKLSAKMLRRTAREHKLKVARKSRVVQPKRRKKPSHSARASSGAVQAMGMPVSS